MEITGERLSSQIKDYWAIEHLHRYGLTFPFIKDKLIVDIASGDGYGSHLMSKYAKKVTGIDISHEAVKFASEKYKQENLTFMQGTASHIPVNDHSVDVVVSFETIEHHDQHEQMLKEIKRILKKDGVLIISSPDKLNYSDIPNYKNPYHVKELYAAEFISLIKGFFRETLFFRQNTIYGSLIMAEELNGKPVQYNGDYQKVYTSEMMQNPMYHIAVCTDSLLDKSLLQNSFFSAEELIGFGVGTLKYEIEELNKKLNDVKNSYSYKIGNSIVQLFSPIKNIFKKN